MIWGFLFFCFSVGDTISPQISCLYGQKHVTDIGFMQMIDLHEHDPSFTRLIGIMQLLPADADFLRSRQASPWGVKNQRRRRANRWAAPR